MDFLTTCTLIAGASLTLSEKFKDVFKPKTLLMKYVINGSATLVMAILANYIECNYSLMLNPYQILATFIVSWLMSGGLYDYLKPLFKK